MVVSDYNHYMNTEYTFDENIVSDLHKDAHGFRPCQNWWADWQSENAVGKQIIWDDLIDALGAANVEEDRRQQEAILKLEAQIVAIMAWPRQTREDAIRWIDEAFDAGGDREYLCYLLGVPYRYFG